MKNFYMAYCTDVGIKKDTNQDSLLIKGAKIGEEEVMFAVLCDGMGGMAKGELASGTVIRSLGSWFTEEFLPKARNWSIKAVENQWVEVLETANQKLIKYGSERQVQLGTTVTAVLIFSHGKYLGIHIGDTRVYHLSNQIKQLTQDHTFVDREVKRGNLTAKEAETDSRRNILLQCIGANTQFVPQFLSGVIEKMMPYCCALTAFGM